MKEKRRQYPGRNRKRWMVALFIAMLLPVMSAAAFASETSEVIDQDRTGSVSVTMQTSSGEALGGGILALYQVAEFYIDEVGQNSYVLTDDFAGSNADLSELSSGELAETLDAYVTEADPGAYQTVEIEADGTAVFENLPVGIYLVVQTEAAMGYYTVSSFVVAVPLEENGTLVYDVNASPKVEAAEEIPEEPTESTPDTTPESESTPDTTPETKATTEPENTLDATSESTTTSESETTTSTTTSTKTGSTLPQTGAILWPIILMAGVGIALLFCGWLMIFEKRGKKYEA